MGTAEEKVIKALKKYKILSSSEIADVTNMSKESVSQSCSRLRKQGNIKRYYNSKKVEWGI